MPKQKMYVLGRGCVWIADINPTTGNPLALREIGECPVFKVEISAEYAENRPTCNAINAKDAKDLVTMDVKLTLQVKEARIAKNLAIATYGEPAVTNSSTVSNLAFPNNILVGETHNVPNNLSNLSNSVIRDSASTPVTLVSGTDYIIDEKFGQVKFIKSDLSSLSQPFKYSGTVGSQESVGLAVKRPDNKYIKLDGIDINNGNYPFVVELWNVQLNPAKELNFKDEKNYMMFDLEGEALVNTLKTADSVLGNVGKITYHATS